MSVDYIAPFANENSSKQGIGICEKIGTDAEMFLDCQVSPEPTPVRWLVSQSVGQLVTLSDFQSVVQIKKFKKQSPFIFEFCFWEDPPHPVNWSPTHSTCPQKLFFLQISALLHFCTFALLYPKVNFSKVYFFKVYFSKVYLSKLY